MPKKHASCTALHAYNMYMAEIHGILYAVCVCARARACVYVCVRLRVSVCVAHGFRGHRGSGDTGGGTGTSRGAPGAFLCVLETCCPRGKIRCHMAQKLLHRGVLLTERQQKDWQ